MWKYLGRRLLQMFITLILFQVLTYLLIDAQPGDIADLLTQNPDIPPGEVQRLRADLGLDRPPLERMVLYIGNFYVGNLGVSFQRYPTAVMDIIVERLPRTIVLFLTANIIAFWAGYITGKILAWRRGGFVEYGSTIIGVGLYTVFLPWFALMMIWLFAVTLDWFPPGKFIDPILWLEPGTPTTNEVFIRLLYTTVIALAVMFVGFGLSNRAPRKQRLPIRFASLLLPLAGWVAFWLASGWAPLAWDMLSHLVLPVLTLTLWSYAGTMLLMRTTMLETLREDYILTARAKGLPDKAVRDKHAARNALLPVWTGLVFGITASISGGIVTETVFSWPGIGLAYLQAAIAEDIPVAMGILTILGVLTLVAHLVVDIGYAFLDPRIRYN
ncbi:MAG: ABC transporter permease [Anaerolineae bacterium]